ncbi:MFS transporter [Clostridium sp. MCC353]|uniref:MFS transporter n=1 Tax=Clostridium sp. MCC353 TaxID=2592646 RepID=UPI001C037004|nr:MFS transporter [Clostridium sp. MCC353]MBT9779784.1 MFS transporter [Clostridium sp. MCC353]
MKKLGNRIWPLIFFSLAANVGNIIFFPVMFYSAFQTVFSLTNAQMGNLTAAYASLAVPGYLISGWVADKFNSKRLMLIAVFSTSAIVFIMATIPSYPVLLGLFFCMSITLGLLFWSAMEKVLRMLGDAGEQGTIRGVYQGIDGIMSLGLMVGMAALLGERLSTPAGMRILLLVFGTIYLISGIGFLVTFKYDELSSRYLTDTGEPVKLKNYATAAKLPAMWIVAVMSFGVYITSTAFNYVNPYMVNMYAMSASLASIYGILLRYGIKIVASPMGGILRDKIDNTPKMVVCTAMPTLVLVILFMFLPKSAGWTFAAVAVSLVFTFSYRMGNNLCSVPFAELAVPSNYLGTAIGMSIFLGYCSDWFLPSLIGRWMDTMGGNAYYYVFGVAVVGLSIFMFGSYLLKMELKKQNGGR